MYEPRTVDELMLYTNRYNLPPVDAVVVTAADDCTPNSVPALTVFVVPREGVVEAADLFPNKFVVPPVLPVTFK